MKDTVLQFWTRFVQPRLHDIGFDIARYPGRDLSEIALSRLIEARDAERAHRLSDTDSFLRYCATHQQQSYSQLFQDLFVRWRLGDKSQGFFVEFGATDGVSLSNTKCLEETRGWRGILAEPARCWHARIRENRTSVVDTRCVWVSSGERLRFSEAAVAEFSTLASYSNVDGHAATRDESEDYEVETVSLNDLLASHEAPSEMDYLSIDTEGSELDILSGFAFDRYRFSVVTVEHNFTANRSRIYELLSGHGYVREFSRLSRWDDWYVHRSLKSRCGVGL